MGKATLKRKPIDVLFGLLDPLRIDHLTTGQLTDEPLLAVVHGKLSLVRFDEFFNGVLILVILGIVSFVFLAVIFILILQ